MIAHTKILSLAHIIFVFVVIGQQHPLHAMYDDYADDRRGSARTDVFELLTKMPKATSRYSDALQALGSIGKLKVQIDADKSISNEDRVVINGGIDELRRKIINGLKNDNKYGRAIASGLAGNEWKALQNEHIDGIRDGIELGLLVRASKACGDALGSRVAETADSLIGGIWDTIMSVISQVWNTMYQDFFHAGEGPFTVEQVKGWQELVKTTFDDLTVLVRDGLKDNLRSHDMTSRSVTSSTEEEQYEEALPSGWKTLINAYVRQFENIKSCLEHSVIYYDGQPNITFYANDLTILFAEVSQILVHAKTIKELDSMLDSSKGILPSLKKNILNLFARLLDIIDVKKTSTRSSSHSLSPMRREMMSRDNDDSGFPHSMR